MALNREYEVASALTAVGAPVAPPVPDMRPVRDLDSGFLVTFWTRLDNDATAMVCQVDVGVSLQSLHEAMAQSPSNCRTSGSASNEHRWRSRMTPG